MGIVEFREWRLERNWHSEQDVNVRELVTMDWKGMRVAGGRLRWDCMCYR